MGSASLKKQQKEDLIRLINNILSAHHVTRYSWQVTSFISYKTELDTSEVLCIQVIQWWRWAEWGCATLLLPYRRSVGGAHVDIFYPASSPQWTLVPEVFLDFSSFRDLCSAPRGSLAALPCGEKSRDEKNQGRPSAPGYPSLEPLHIHLMIKGNSCHIIQRDWNLLNVNWDQSVDTRHENVRLVTLSRATISYISGKKK